LALAGRSIGSLVGETWDRAFVPPADPKHPRNGKGSGHQARVTMRVRRVGFGPGGHGSGEAARAGAACTSGQPPGGRYVEAARAASSISVAVTSTTVRTLAAPLALTASAAPAAVMLSG
jgi:hypothetical protein